MTRADFDAVLHEIQHAELEVRTQGQNEYARDDENCFANFDRVSKELGVSRETVLLTYAMKHWDGILSWVVDGHRSQREDIRGRIKDLRMYLALLWGMVNEGNEPGVKSCVDCSATGVELRVGASGTVVCESCHNRRVGMLDTAQAK